MHIPDVTIVIPVHGRQWTLHRCLGNLVRFDGPVIVADSSPEPFSDIAQFPAVDYRHMPGMPYYRNLREVYASVETPFLIDVPDDDFVVLSGLADCCAYMRAHPDVGLCAGHIVMFKAAREAVAQGGHIDSRKPPRHVQAAIRGQTILHGLAQAHRRRPAARAFELHLLHQAFTTRAP